jgi:integrase
MARTTNKKKRGVFELPVKSGVWWVRYTDQYGILHREKVGMKSVAEHIYQQRKTEIRLGKFEPDEVKNKHRNSTVVEILDDFILSCKGRQLKTVGGIQQRIAWWNEHFRERAARSITPSDIENARVELAKSKLRANGHRIREGGRKPATVNRYLAALKAACSLAVRNGKLDRNPVSMVKLQKENNCRVRWLADDEEARLFEALPAQYHSFVLMALYTGMRRMELLKLCWADVNFQQRLITIRESKSGESRVIPMHEVVYDTLRKLPRRIDNPFVFPGKASGSHLTEIPHSWERFLRNAQISDFRWHDFRHTFASRLVMAGANLLEVKKLLGHREMKMTERYAHLSPQYLKQTIELLSNPNPTGTKTDTKGNRRQSGIR